MPIASSLHFSGANHGWLQGTVDWLYACLLDIGEHRVRLVMPLSDRRSH
jgi:hypothetical protein